MWFVSNMEILYSLSEAGYRRFLVDMANGVEVDKALERHGKERGIVKSVTDLAPADARDLLDDLRRK